MNITIVTLSLTTGGAERVICNLCNEELASKHKVTVISLMAAAPEYELDHRVRLIHVDKNESQYRQNPILRMRRRKWELLRILDALGAVDHKKKNASREEGQDVILSFLPEPNFLVCELHGKLRCPVIISVRNDPVREYGSTLRKLLMKRDYPKADGYVFQTEQAREYFSFNRHIIDASVVIPNPLGREFCIDASSDSVIKKRRILYAGRLERAKNPEMIIRAFSEIHKSHPDHELYLYGEGSMRGRLEMLIQDLQLEKSVFLPGLAENMKKVYQEAEFFVLASDYEGMPNSLMEAMAMGLPCIATNCPCGGPEYLIEDGVNGILIPVGNQEALQKAMHKLLQDCTYPVRLGLKAKQIREKLIPEKVYKMWSDYIDAVCGGKQ